MSGDPEVYVKNTFLDVRDPAPELRRVYTEPGRSPPEEVSEALAAYGGGDCSPAAYRTCEAEAEADAPGRFSGSDETEGMPSEAEWLSLGDHLGFHRKVIVKNTFLDLDDDDSPAPPILRRVKTEPLPVVDSTDADSSQGDSSPTNSRAPSDGEGESYRLMTCQSVECSSEWNWGSGSLRPTTPNAPRHLAPISEDDDSPRELPAPAAAAEEPAPAQESTQAVAQAAAPAAAPVAAPAMAPVQMAQGIMMVPSGMLMPGVVGMGTIDNLPPGCVAVPVDRYARWPGGLPPVAPPCQAAPVLSRVKSPDQPPAGPAGAPATEPEVTRVPSVPSPVTASSSPRPQADQPVLQRAFSVASAIFRVNWTVAARKLKSKDQFAVSPKFELSFKTPCEFKMVIHPTKTSDQKGGKSFLAAKGKGRVELKCETQLDSGAEAVMTYRISVGAGDKRMQPRGPVKHNFADSSVSGLAADEEEWDFSAVCPEGAQTFVVCLEVLPAGAA